MMCFRLIFYILATALVVARCQEVPHEEGDGPHEYYETGKKTCPSSRMIKNVQKVMVMPRERHVILKPEKGYEFHPPIVAINRCNGECPKQYSPMPKEKMNRTFTVQLHREGVAWSEKCVDVIVEEHMMCKCMCMKMAKDCTAKQWWDENNCACVCKHRETNKMNCEARKGMVWIDADCSCTCPHKIMECQPPKIWDKSICNCVLKDRHQKFIDRY